MQRSPSQSPQLNAGRQDTDDIVLYVWFYHFATFRFCLMDKGRK